jgi:hypothetical protein
MILLGGNWLTPLHVGLNSENVPCQLGVSQVVSFVLDRRIFMIRALNC